MLRSPSVSPRERRLSFGLASPPEGGHLLLPPHDPPEGTRVKVLQPVEDPPRLAPQGGARIRAFRKIMEGTGEHRVQGNLLLWNPEERLDPADPPLRRLPDRRPGEPGEVPPEAVHHHRLGLVIQVVARGEGGRSQLPGHPPEGLPPVNPAEATGMVAAPRH